MLYYRFIAGFADCHFAGARNSYRSYCGLNLEVNIAVNIGQIRGFVSHICAMLNFVNAKLKNFDLLKEKVFQQLRVIDRKIPFYSNRCSLDVRVSFIDTHSLYSLVTMYQSGALPLNCNLNLINHPCCRVSPGNELARSQILWERNASRDRWGVPRPV